MHSNRHDSPADRLAPAAACTVIPAPRPQHLVAAALIAGALGGLVADAQTALNAPPLPVPWVGPVYAVVFGGVALPASAGVLWLIAWWRIVRRRASRWGTLREFGTGLWVFLVIFAVGGLVPVILIGIIYAALFMLANAAWQLLLSPINQPAAHALLRLSAWTPLWLLGLAALAGFATEASTPASDDSRDAEAKKQAEAAHPKPWAKGVTRPGQAPSAPHR